MLTHGSINDLPGCSNLSWLIEQLIASLHLSGLETKTQATG
jgi:hypothetical protein